MTLLKAFGYTVFSLVLTLIVGDLLGVTACFLGDLVHPGSWSMGAEYAVWFVLGVFGGMFHYFLAVGLCGPDATPSGPAPKAPLSRALTVIGITIVVLSLLSYACERIWWVRGVDSPDGYVPDSKSATMVFFITLVATMIFSRWVSQLEPGPRKQNRATKH